MATQRKPIPHGYAALLVTAIRKLRVFESLWQDLSYPEGDARRAMPDAELPLDVVTERDYLRREVVRYAALTSGEDHTDAIMFADTPLAAVNPYNLERVAEAAAMFLGESF